MGRGGDKIKKREGVYLTFSNVRNGVHTYMTIMTIMLNKAKSVLLNCLIFKFIYHISKSEITFKHGENFANTCRLNDVFVLYDYYSLRTKMHDCLHRLGFALYNHTSISNSLSLILKKACLFC